MRSFLRIAALVAVAAVPLAASAQQRVVRTINQSYDPTEYSAVVLDMKAGEVNVKGGDVDTILAEVRVGCPRDRDLDTCRERAEVVEVTTRERSGKLVLYVEGPSFWRSRDTQLRVEITLPQRLGFELDLSAGDVEISDVGGAVVVDVGAGDLMLTDLRGDVTVDLGAGDITLTMNQDLVATVALDNGIGETRLRHRSGNLSREGIMPGHDVRWTDGTGEHRVEINLNVGEILVRLQ